MKTYIDLEDMANLNCSKVLDIIQKNGELSRKQISELTGLSWGGMTKIVNKLIESGYIVEDKISSSAKAGRTPSFLSVNTHKNFVMGLDINQTGLNAIVMNLKGEILKSYSKSPNLKCTAELLNDITKFTSEIFDEFEEKAIISIGIAMQGIVDNEKGISVKFPAIKGWENVDLKNILEEKFGVDVFIEHDPDCILYPYTLNNKIENLLLLRIDKSIGMAVAMKGKIIKGKGIFEIAHSIVVPGGKKCSCGNSGCLEAYLSPCIENDRIIPENVAEFITPLSVSLYNLAGIFNIDKFIITGKLAESKALFKDKLKNELKALNQSFEPEFIELSECAVQGAALIAISKSINSLLI